LVSILSTTATSRLHVVPLVLGAGLLAAGCGVDENLGEISAEVAVSTYTTTSCSTSVVLGLSKQIADEVGCMNPTSLVRFTPTANLQITSNAVLPYLGANAKTGLQAVAATRTVQVNSAFRTVVQQYLLYRWNQLGRCGITAAATPGRSNHESGRALDLANYSSLVSAMAAKGWSHSVPGDPVHFDHLGSPDIRGKDVLAFQRLWNRNNPGDRIGEDGAYGPQTEARVRSAPATGFATGATCAAAGFVGADVVMIEGPDKVAPGARAHFTVTVDNKSAVDWPASTEMVVMGGGTSELYDRQTWASASRVGTIGGDIGAGARGVIEIDVQAPMVTEETGYFTQLALSSEGTSLATIDVALTVTPNGDDDTSADAGDSNDSEDTTGGCSTGGGAGSWAALLIPALVLVRRRRRA
jgi:uncharacterized protein (TIGR03382 family)